MAENVDFDSISPNEWLVREVPYSDAEVSFSAGSVDQEMANFLSMSIGEPVFIAERNTWLDGSPPITYAKMIFAKGYRMTTLC